MPWGNYFDLTVWWDSVPGHIMVDTADTDTPWEGADGNIWGVHWDAAGKTTLHLRKVGAWKAAIVRVTADNGDIVKAFTIDPDQGASAVWLNRRMTRAGVWGWGLNTGSRGEYANVLVNGAKPKLQVGPWFYQPLNPGWNYAIGVSQNKAWLWNGEAKDLPQKAWSASSSADDILKYWGLYPVQTLDWDWLLDTARLNQLRSASKSGMVPLYVWARGFFGLGAGDCTTTLHVGAETLARVKKIDSVGQVRRGWAIGALFAQKYDRLAASLDKTPANPAIAETMWGDYSKRPDAGLADLAEVQTWELDDLLPINTGMTDNAYYQTFQDVLRKRTWVWIDRVDELGPYKTNAVTDLDFNGVKLTESLQNLPVLRPVR